MREGLDCSPDFAGLNDSSCFCFRNFDEFVCRGAVIIGVLQSNRECICSIGVRTFSWVQFWSKGRPVDCSKRSSVISPLNLIFNFTSASTSSVDVRIDDSPEPSERILEYATMMPKHFAAQVARLKLAGFRSPRHWRSSTSFRARSRAPRSTISPVSSGFVARRISVSSDPLAPARVTRSSPSVTRP